MNFRCGFVSNSSSCAFIVYGRKLSDDEVRQILEAVYNYYKDKPDDENYDYFVKDFDVDEIMNEPYEVADYLGELGIYCSDEDSCGETSYFLGRGNYIDYMDEFDPNEMKEDYKEYLDKLKTKFKIELPETKPALYGYRVVG